MNAQRVDSSKINRVKNVIICQKCKLPLDVSETNEFDDSTQIYKKLGFKDTQQNEEILQKSGHLFDSLYSKTENSNNDLKNKKMQCIEFYLGPNEFKYDGSIYDKFKQISLNMDIINKETEITSPICINCIENVCSLLEGEIKAAKNQNNIYKSYIDHLTALQNEKSLDQLEIEYDELQKENVLLCTDLDKFEKEWDDVQNDIQKELAIKKENDKKLKRYHIEKNEYLHRKLAISEAHSSIKNQINYVKDQFSRLVKTNVFKSTFQIWFKDSIGTINGFRMGWLPEMNITCDEINFGFGQCVLLLNSMARKIGIDFEKYRMVSFGNESYIEELSVKCTKKLILYMPHTLKYTPNKEFDKGLVAFLACKNLLSKKLMRMDNSIVFPYIIESDRLLDQHNKSAYSIRTVNNTQEQWTRALKFMLSNLKWGIAFVSSYYYNECDIRKDI